MNPQDMLDKLTMHRLDLNKETLRELDEKLQAYLSGRDSADDVAQLYACDIDDQWFDAQCRAARRQIAKVLEEESTFYKYYRSILEEDDLVLLTKELICDVAQLDRIGHGRLGLDHHTGRDSYLASNQFFLHAKFSFFTRKYIVETTQRNFDFSSMPTLIRQAIEIKINNMIGLQRVTAKDGRFKLVSISRLLGFFEKDRRFIALPVKITTLKAINAWTNNFVHTGVAPLCWQSLEAIDLIEDLFAIKDMRTSAMHLHGFNYLKKGVTLEALKAALDATFDADFSLSERAFESVRLDG